MKNTSNRPSKNDSSLTRTEYYFLDGKGKDVTNIVLAYTHRLGSQYYFPYEVFYCIRVFSLLYSEETFTAVISPRNFDKINVYLISNGTASFSTYFAETRSNQ